jgi:hypothetical protein
MEITKKEAEILIFVKKFKYCREEHIRAFIDKSMAVTKRIEHLIWQKEIYEYKDIITVREEKDIDMTERDNILKVLDIATQLKIENKITEIELMDEPFYIAAKSRKSNYLYMTIINKGKEMIQLKLVDNENKGGTILILEDNTQVEHLRILTTKVSKVIIYENFLEDKKI